MRKALMWLPLLLIGLSPATWAVTPEAWKHTAYAYDARQTELATALADFAKEFGMALDMPPIPGVLDDRIRAQSPEEFLDRLGQEYHFQWFVYNDTLYVSPSSEHTSARIEVSSDAVDDLQTALTDVGLLDKRFGWGVLPNEGVVLVRGPAKYVELVRDYSKKVEAPEKGDKQDIIVFPLKYASAADRTIRYRDQQLVVAGVASILQDLLDTRSHGGSINGMDLLGRGGRGNGLAGGGAPDAPSLPMSSSGLDTNALEQGLDQVLHYGGGGGSKSGGKSRSGGRANIRVTADVRNNAVLIYDLPSRKAMYEKLIKELDVSRNLIEIDAVILDIDRNELAELSSRWNFNAGSVNGGANMFDAGTSSTLFIQNAGKFAAELHALEGNGSASVIGNPSILTLENQPAVIDFSRTEYLTATSERVANIEPITAGTSLQVTPRSLDHDGKPQVQLIVDIEDGQIDISDINDTQPSVRKGNVSTQAVIAEHGSLVIGGFHGLEANDKIHKVPLLGDIPYVGKLLFQSRSRELSQRERLFILTPRLIGDQVNPARYVQNGNPHDVDDQMKRIKERRDGGELPTRGDIQKVFTQMVDGAAPEGMHDGETLPFETDSLCDPGQGLTLDGQRSQWYARKDWGVAVVVARNNTDKPVRIDESRCGGRWVIGVAAWPHAWLQPGEESEVYIAVRQPQISKMAKESRPSLLRGAKP
ncbi:type III secretion system outer membrane ring subunit SctC [Pseudomonas syringae pv. aptata]|uniref:Type 3 secretion system secretin n=1 Tax=Pseudomonas syringae TaxID=317 RepID=A0AAQ1L2L3_PSESX|nr:MULTISPECIES: type III secretion system outer membrane ring subunit SctC [Pseudomonas]AKF52793.1 type III secretion outer membrane pore,YscC/HrcC family [Pseudomonas syringae pv. syringae HS191]AZG85452.1 EscC/YscC/HrcC family type III secretion system outer membrane ring protein [Pseudomonas syringae pv. pisi str. PP1]ELQ03391.1 outer-membrane type III secretion protein HrcC [Pseudomonas syringae BRIP34876]ELQ03639.1 outer-membrane type III secretion protein HrcC [Pseudomonas syringae BRIP3